MKKAKKKKTKKVRIEEIEELALQGKDVNKYFKGGKMMPSMKVEVQRVNVDFGINTLHELDVIATELNISRQALIKLFIQRELDHHYLARKARKDVG